MLTTKRPPLPEGESMPYGYIDGTIYYENSFMATHPVLVKHMIEAGITKNQIRNGIFGYVENEGHDVPEFLNMQESDMFPSDPDPNSQSDLRQKLEAVFPGIKHQLGYWNDVANDPMPPEKPMIQKNPFGFSSSWRFADESDTIPRMPDMSSIDTAVKNEPAANLAIDALNRAGGRVFVVGGAVRDAVLGATPKDIDLMVQGLDDEKIVAALENIGRLDLTGKAFGVYRFKNGKSEVEIALPRTEESTGLGHKDFMVTTDPHLDPEADLARRDFTGNAMAYDPTTKTFIDPHGGAQDLQEGRLSLVNDKAFEDDPLRIVRALVANARFGLEPDEQLKQALKDNAQRLRHLPGERIQMELDKLLSSADPTRAIQLAEQSELIPYLFPELEAAVGFDQMNPHHDLDVFTHTMQVLKKMATLTNDPDLRLAALFHDSGKPDSFWRDETAPEGGGGHFYKKVEDDGTVLGANHEEVGAERVNAFMTRLRYPNARIDRVTKLVEFHMFPYFKSAKGARKFLRALNGDEKMAFDLFLLRESDASGKSTNDMSTYDKEKITLDRRLLQEVLESEDGFTLKDLAVNGHDVAQLGFKGPQIGQVLNKLLDAVVDNPELNEKDTLLQMVQDAHN